MDVRLRNRGACKEEEALPVTPHWSMSTELLISKGRFRKSYFLYIFFLPSLRFSVWFEMNRRWQRKTWTPKHCN